MPVVAWMFLLAGVLIVQALLIVGLLVQRRRRQRSEARNRALLQAIPDFMFIQSADGVYLDYHAPDPRVLLVSPEQFLGRHMRDVLPPGLYRTVEPAFARAVNATEPVIVEYDVAAADAMRRYEARLVRSSDQQVLTFVRDITQRKQSEDALRESEAILQASNREIQDLAGRLIASQELERTRLARDLHDDLSQQIAGLSIALSGVRRRLADIPDARELVGEVSAIQQRTTGLADNIRRLSHDLHPSVLQRAGLIAALEAHCAEIEQQQRVAVTFIAEGEFESTPSAAALCLYRIAQESLRNVVTHAKATHVEVRLVRVDGQADLTVIDDGRGFDVAAARRQSSGLGLVSIAERARLVGGTVSIFTEVGKGTRLQVQVPAEEHLWEPQSV